MYPDREQLNIRKTILSSQKEGLLSAIKELEVKVKTIETEEEAIRLLLLLWD